MTDTRNSAAGAGMAPAPAVILDLAAAENECGDPALERVRRAYAALAPGELLEARSPIAEHAFAVRAWCRREGADLVCDERDGVAVVLRVRRPA